MFHWQALMKTVKYFLNNLVVIDFRGMNLLDHVSYMFYTDSYLMR